MLGLLKGVLRGTTEPRNLEVSRRGALFVAQDLPAYARLVNDGVCWEVGEASLVAAVTAPPTTTAGISLYNDNPEGGATIIVFEVFGLQGGTPAALNSWGISGCVQDVIPGTKPTQDIAKTSVKGLKARQGNYGGGAIIDLAATVTDDLWKPLGSSVNTVVVSLTGSQLVIPLYLPRILPPGGMMSLKGTASAVDVTLRLGFRFAEVQL